MSKTHREIKRTAYHANWYRSVPSDVSEQFSVSEQYVSQIQDPSFFLFGVFYLVYLSPHEQMHTFKYFIIVCSDNMKDGCNI